MGVYLYIFFFSHLDGYDHTEMVEIQMISFCDVLFCHTFGALSPKWGANNGWFGSIPLESFPDVPVLEYKLFRGIHDTHLFRCERYKVLTHFSHWHGIWSAWSIAKFPLDMAPWCFWLTPGSIGRFYKWGDRDLMSISFNTKKSLVFPCFMFPS